MLRIWNSVAGLAHDYWKDGNWGNDKEDLGDLEIKSSSRGKSSPVAPVKAENLWHAKPSEIVEKMWGAGYVLPGDAQLTERLISPLGLTKDMNILDLSAGLGERPRKTAKEFGIPVKGLEADPEIAARGKELSMAQGAGKHALIEYYDPLSFSTESRYDCVVSRETIYRVSDKQKFIKAIVSCCKSKAQFSFTDYIVNPEAREHPAIAAWYAFENGASALGLVEMAELWAKEGVNIRVHDDLTDFYKTEVKNGLLRFAKFMESGVKPDAETAKAINKHITSWAHRMAAIEHGMKFYRFYGQR